MVIKKHVTIILILSMLFISGCVDETPPDLTTTYSEEIPSSAYVDETPPVDLTTTYLEEIPSSVYNLFPKLDASLLDYSVTNNGIDVLDVTFSSEIRGYTDMAINTEQIEPGETKTISQTPLFKPGVLDTLTETRTANLYYKVTYSDYNGETVLDEETTPIELYAKDTMLWGVVEDGEYFDLSHFIAAWVTPHAVEVDELVRIAAEYHPERSMGAAETPDDRFLQIEAIYDALQNDYYITYISSTISYSGSETSSQRVKLPSDSINLASANCIDGTVLFASALENIGINPYIVIVPGHAFLAWGDGEGNVEGVLETTMVGNSEFYDAYESGLQQYNELVMDENSEESLISIKEARAIGITPMR